MGAIVERAYRQYRQKIRHLILEQANIEDTYLSFFKNETLHHFDELKMLREENDAHFYHEAVDLFYLSLIMADLAGVKEVFLTHDGNDSIALLETFFLQHLHHDKDTDAYKTFCAMVAGFLSAFERDIGSGIVTKRADKIVYKHNKKR